MRRVSTARRMLHIPSPEATFYIWPEYQGRVRFAVKIFGTSVAMRRYLKHVRPERKHNEDLAFTDNRTCEIVFCRSYLDAETIAHEVTHAAFWWANTVRLKPEVCMRWDSSTHERIAEAIGYMVGQITRKVQAPL